MLWNPIYWSLLLGVCTASQVNGDVEVKEEKNNKEIIFVYNTTVLFAKPNSKKGGITNFTPASPIPQKNGGIDAVGNLFENPIPTIEEGMVSQKDAITDLYENPVLQENTIINSIFELCLDISTAQWKKRYAGNVVLSPVGIGALLNLILLGVRGDTYKELNQALHYPKTLPDALIHETYQKVIGSVSRSQSREVNSTISSRMFLQEGFNILGKYAQVAQALYDSTVQNVDFLNSPLKTKDLINAWVSKSTFGKIENFIAGPVSSDTKLIAVNTIYFNGGWQYPFSKFATFDGTFSTGYKNISIPMMTNILNVPYLKGNITGFDMVSLPYEGNRFSLYILRPNTRGIRPLQSLEYSLNFDKINSLIDQMRTTKVTVTIPRMKLNSKTFLKEDLKSLGVESLFDPVKADFGRLTTDTGVYVNDIVHEAILEVTETGTVAAAASASTIDRNAPDYMFTLNRPSLLFIRDNNNGLLLFWARVVDPVPIIL